MVKVCPFWVSNVPEGGVFGVFLDESILFVLPAPFRHPRYSYKGIPFLVILISLSAHCFGSACEAGSTRSRVRSVKLLHFPLWKPTRRCAGTHASLSCKNLKVVLSHHALAAFQTLQSSSQQRHIRPAT